jgi:hypothetical protein
LKFQAEWCSNGEQKEMGWTISGMKNRLNTQDIDARQGHDARITGQADAFGTNDFKIDEWRNSSERRGTRELEASSKPVLDFLSR